jgi:hypothetical protein
LSRRAMAISVGQPEMMRRVETNGVQGVECWCA